MTGVAVKVDQPGSRDAYVYATVETARIKLYLGDLDGARKALDEAEKILDQFDSVEPVVNASFYRVNADYYHVGPDPQDPHTHAGYLLTTDPSQGKARICFILQECPSIPSLHPNYGPHIR